MSPFYCPSCGQMIGGSVRMTLKHIECMVCGAVWVCENFEELFGKAYPNAGKKNHEQTDDH